MDITPETRLLAIAHLPYLREVLESFEVPVDRASVSRWSLAEACRIAEVNVDDVIIELELAESESDWDDEMDEDWAYAG